MKGEVQKSGCACNFLQQKHAVTDGDLQHCHLVTSRTGLELKSASGCGLGNHAT